MREFNFRILNTLCELQFSVPTLLLVVRIKLCEVCLLRLKFAAVNHAFLLSFDTPELTFFTQRRFYVSPVETKFNIPLIQQMWCDYKILGLMLEHFVFKKLHNRNIVTLNVLSSPILTPLHAKVPLLGAMLQVFV
jgi:hypothetical protein